MISNFFLAISQKVKKCNYLLIKNKYFKGLIQINNCDNVTLNLVSLVSVYESDNLIIVTNSKIDVTFGRFENYYAQNFTMFTINNTILTLSNTFFSNFTAVLIYSSIGSIEIENCIFNNVFEYSSYVNDYAIKLENNVSFHMKNSQFQYLRNYNKVSIKFYKNQDIKLYKGDLFNKYHNIRVYKFNRRLFLQK